MLTGAASQHGRQKAGEAPAEPAAPAALQRVQVAALHALSVVASDRAAGKALRGVLPQALDGCVALMCQPQVRMHYAYLML